MAVTFRTAGIWGAGKGSNLTPEEVDENFFTLVTQITNLEENAPAGVGISSINVNGTQFTVTLTDNSVLGPFELPAASMRWTGDYEAGAEYVSLDLFAAEGGVYLVTASHTAATEFDPAETSDTEGSDLYIKMFDLSGRLNLRDVTSSFTLTISDAGGYIRCTSATAINCTIPSVADVAWEEGDIITLRQVGAGQVELLENTEVTLLSPETFKTRAQHSTITMVYVGNDTWDVSGDMELA